MVLLTATAPLSAQSVVRGTVLSNETGTPIRDARVTVQSTGLTVQTDGAGQFRVLVTRVPDTLLVRAIGRMPMAVALTSDAAAPLVLRLATAPVMLVDIAVTGHAEELIAAPAQWALPPELIRELPAAIEPDVFRGLQLVPGVAFSSVYSSRPLLRGYAADDGALRIDEFEVLNLYHVGRAFSAFPLDAASKVTVTPGAEAAGRAEALSGSVGLAGRRGSSSSQRGGATLSPASLTGWLGGGESVRAFGLGRIATFTSVDLITENSIPYDFFDAYGSLTLSHEGTERAHVTLFGSRDHLFDSEAGSGMDWDNVLAGATGVLHSDGRHRVQARFSYTQFTEEVRDVQARSSRINVDNLFSRIQGGVDWTFLTGKSVIAAGMVLSGRRIDNAITPLSGQDFEADTFNTRRAELGGHASWTGAIGRVQLEAGARFDMAGSTAVFQPRAFARTSLGTRSTIGLGVGRSSRLFHLISDPAPEPDLAFYDFWLDAARDDVPTPIVDHAAIDYAWVGRTVSLRLGLYGSRGRGLIELRPASDQDTARRESAFRTGESRTAGLEAAVTWQSANGAHGLTGLYALTTSERRWNGGWIPWQLDRRHLARVNARTTPTRGIVLSVAIEFMSGAPLTPVQDIVLSGLSSDSGGLQTGGTPTVRYIYGQEGQLRSDATIRADLGGTYSFGGPGRSRWTLGVSVLNVAAGPVAPDVPRDVNELQNELMQGRPAQFSYVRAFDVPPIPTVFVRVEF